MENQQNKLPQIIDGSPECRLELSHDSKWMRLIIDGKLVASFHVNYVSKVLEGKSEKTISEHSERKPEPTANL